MGGVVMLEDEDTSLDPALTGGVVVSFDRGARRKLDIVYARQETTAERIEPFEPPVRGDVSVDYLHIGGRYQLVPRGRFDPYVAGTIGATRVAIRGSGGAGFSFSFGLGADLRLRRAVALRFDGRFFTTAGTGEAELVCDDSGQCSGFSSGSTFTQVVVSTGIAFRLGAR
jgi:hypothetical protein